MVVENDKAQKEMIKLDAESYLKTNDGVKEDDLVKT